MTKADYIRQVDAMDLPDGLRQRLGALPETRETRRAGVVAPYKGRETQAHIVRPYGRWAAIAAALVLVVGLGVAAPALIQFFSTGGDIITPPPVVTEAPAISDEELTNLLIAEYPYPYEGDEHTFLFSASQEGRTLGVLHTQGGGGGGNYGSLLFGVFDNATKALIGDTQFHGGDFGEMDSWIEEKMRTRIVWTNYTTSMGVDFDCAAGMYTFEHGELTAITDIPIFGEMGSAPSGADTMFNPEKNAAFWENHKAELHDAGLSIYRRNPDFNYITNSDVDQWIYDGFVSLSHIPIGPDTAPAISDAELTELLAAEIPLERHQQDTWKLLGSSASPEGRTLGVLQYEWAGSDGTPDSTTNWSNLLLGVYDNATRELTGPVIRVNGQLTYALPYSTGSGGQDYYVLCVGSNHGQGIAENFNVALYYFDGMELKQVSTSPNAVLPEGMENMFDPSKYGDFWKDNNHKIVLAPGGFELFERNPVWDSSPYRAGVDPWRYMGYVPLAYKYPDPAALEGARQFYEDYYTGSSYYSFQLCELVPDYEDIDYPNAHAYHVVLDVGQDAVMDRYFLFDEDGTLLGTRSIPEGSLTIGGVSYALGIHTRNIFGTPVKINLIPSTGSKSHYSEWFSPNANACGYTYYPATGEYRLSGISTIREDAYTARGIHVGSTVAEVIAAYPEADKEFSTQANYLSYYGPGFTIEFYFSTSLSREEMLKQTVTSINLSAEYW